MNIVQRTYPIIRDILKSAFIGLAVGTMLFIGVTGIRAAVSSTPSDPADSIVKVLNQAGTGGGTGWAARTKSGRAVIVTNDHVCAVAVNNFVVLEQRGGRKSIKAILSRNAERDLCVIEGLSIPTLSIAGNEPKEFDTLNVLGHPLLNPLTPSTGQYVADGIMQVGFSPEEDGTCRAGQLMDAFIGRPPSFTTPYDALPMGLFEAYCVLNMELSYTTVPIFPGNSGSPVMNTSGQVVGVMNSASSRDNRGNFIPLVYVKQALAR